jgi:hypothetical protein
MDLRLATLKAISFLFAAQCFNTDQCRNLSCGTVVCKHFAIYQSYPNHGWNLIW